MDAGDFVAAWGGVSGLQLALSVVWSQASARGHTLADVVRWMCSGPAKLANLVGKKGAIAPGADADLVVFADHERWTVTAGDVHHRHKVTPYAGEPLRGVVHATYLRGRKIAERGRLVAGELGELL
jgi:allantoinase